MKDIRITEMRVYIVDRGDDGYTPIKGVDYFTQEDIREMASKVQIEIGNFKIATEEDLLKILQ